MINYSGKLPEKANARVLDTGCYIVNAVTRSTQPSILSSTRTIVVVTWQTV